MRIAAIYDIHGNLPALEAALAEVNQASVDCLVIGGDVLFCHATPQDDITVFTKETPEERLVPLFDGLDVAMVVCGHTHMQFDRMVAGVRVINAGSVGMPFGHTGADWLLLDGDVSLRHTDYDLAAAAERIRRSAYPHAEEFAAGNILQAPTVAQAMAMLTRLENTQRHIP